MVQRTTWARRYPLPVFAPDPAPRNAAAGGASRFPSRWTLALRQLSYRKDEAWPLWSLAMPRPCRGSVPAPPWVSERPRLQLPLVGLRAREDLATVQLQKALPRARQRHGAGHLRQTRRRQELRSHSPGVGVSEPHNASAVSAEHWSFSGKHLLNSYWAPGETDHLAIRCPVIRPLLSWALPDQRPEASIDHAEVAHPTRGSIGS